MNEIDSLNRLYRELNDKLEALSNDEYAGIVGALLKHAMEDTAFAIRAYRRGRTDERMAILDGR